MEVIEQGEEDVEADKEKGGEVDEGEVEGRRTRTLQQMSVKRLKTLALPAPPLQRL